MASRQSGAARSERVMERLEMWSFVPDGAGWSTVPELCRPLPHTQTHTNTMPP